MDDEGAEFVRLRGVGLRAGTTVQRRYRRRYKRRGHRGVGDRVPQPVREVAADCRCRAAVVAVVFARNERAQDVLRVAGELRDGFAQAAERAEPAGV